MPYALYYATAPAPTDVTPEKLRPLIAVHFTSVEDALHAAALVLRGGQHVWLIEGPGMRLSAPDVEERCRPILELFSRPRVDGS
jgi:hypothetical protein